MALQITSAVKGAGTCTHYLITVNEDGTPYQVSASAQEIQDWIDQHLGTHNRAVALAMIWASYKRSKGATLASLLNVDIA